MLHRRVSRVLLLDRDNRILLFLTHSPKTLNRPQRWLTPGGGVEDSETHYEGARRELYEETGLQVDSLVGPVRSIHGETVLANGEKQATYTEFFFHRTDVFEISRENWLEYEHEDIKEVRWFTQDELSGLFGEYAPHNLLELYESVRVL